MTYQDDCTLPNDLLEQLTEQGLESLPNMIRILVSEAMRIERQSYLGAGPYERTPERRGRANSYKTKKVKTRIGEIAFDVSQVREGGFYPGALEKGLRSEHALTLTLAEMYVQGVSTRKVATITEVLCGTSVSSTQMSRAAALLDEVLEAWRNRPLGEVIYLYLDGRYEKMRMDGQIRDAAVLIASGVGKTGKRQILGPSVSLSEAEVHWRTFLKDLVARGMQGSRLVISDDHVGLENAEPCWEACPGSAVSSTCSRMQASMFPANLYARKWRRTSGPFSMLRTRRRQRRIWRERWRSMPRQPPNSRPGWRKVF